MAEELQGLEKLKYKLKAEPLVPLGCMLTAGILVGGLVSMKRGNKVMAQKMLRARVLAQFGTMVAIGYGAYYTAMNREEYDDSQYVGNLGNSNTGSH
mmetsp:Transcript_7514/g.9552  ORF Transcript_7514/g.9552 Transcript_7514/m.9552 type:complete len:97 (+) Transcript_7514:307-597(+)|eukprot:CAMPEP_0204831528 /NCGR_PEP_ID=MMETSP1346-20131115/10833_1 /ASSEMBLY_ACC=CAM_ASM_000771 /TAXON_ID=215587 /ORGANISM="Aplanochytrium stocchinoi, Strain GSBS06" /LENGTH=96 /DNA_ID=CAMNT_0051962623 /DNA_START=249 /DNA_END=539 /DNA_ORIENTATION=-